MKLLFTTHPLHPFIRKSIEEDFGFDYKCVVCLGEVSNQDDKME